MIGVVAEFANTALRLNNVLLEGELEESFQHGKLYVITAVF